MLTTVNAPTKNNPKEIWIAHTHVHACTQIHTPPSHTHAPPLTHTPRTRVHTHMHAPLTHTHTTHTPLTYTRVRTQTPLTPPHTLTHTPHTPLHTHAHTQTPDTLMLELLTDGEMAPIKSERALEKQDWRSPKVSRLHSTVNHIQSGSALSLLNRRLKNNYKGQIHFAT